MPYLLLLSQICSCHGRTFQCLCLLRYEWHVSSHVRGMMVAFPCERRWSVLWLVRYSMKRDCWAGGRCGKELLTVKDWLYRCWIWLYTWMQLHPAGPLGVPHHTNTSDTSNTFLIQDFCSSEAKWAQEIFKITHQMITQPSNIKNNCCVKSESNISAWTCSDCFTEVCTYYTKPHIFIYCTLHKEWQFM